MAERQQTPKRVVVKIASNPILQKGSDSKKILRVAAYCRVSTDSEDQLQSYHAQMKHYTDLINKNSNWKMVGIYADEGISGTRVNKRVQFKKMIKDCEKGKIDYILTKSVARFARNTVDSLNYVRKLKSMGIGVFFEEQNLDSLKADSEMFIGIHSVIAQTESENISANVRWGIQQRMKAGTFKMRFNMLGYKRGENGDAEIVESEAKIIRLMFKMFLQGYSTYKISDYLNEHGYTTKKGSKWIPSTVKNTLKNEKYCGDFIMQKTYVDNCISKRSKENKGEFPKYIIRNHHPAIVERSCFDAVQVEIAKRNAMIKKEPGGEVAKSIYCGLYALTGKVICENCGCTFKRKTIKGVNNSRRPIWMCSNRSSHNKSVCNSPILDEKLFQKSICRGLYNFFMKNKYSDSIKSGFDYLVSGDDGYLVLGSIEEQINQYNKQLDNIIAMMMRTQGDTKKYESEIQAINEKIVELNNEKKRHQAIMEAGYSNNKTYEFFNKLLKNPELFFNWNEVFVRKIFNQIIVSRDMSISIQLKGGFTIEEKVEKKEAERRKKVIN